MCVHVCRYLHNALLRRSTPSQYRNQCRTSRGRNLRKNCVRRERVRSVASLAANSYVAPYRLRSTIMTSTVNDERIRRLYMYLSQACAAETMPEFCVTQSATNNQQLTKSYATNIPHVYIFHVGRSIRTNIRK